MPFPAQKILFLAKVVIIITLIITLIDTDDSYVYFLFEFSRSAHLCLLKGSDSSPYQHSPKLRHNLSYL
jgi:hypothetical protein